MIKSYQEKDYEMICNWWKDQNECPPLKGMMIENGTFILEIEKIPALSLTVLLTQSKEIAYLEGFIKNPLFKISLHKESQNLWNHCFEFAKNLGYKRVVCYCMEEKLINKYKQLGMINTANNLNSFVREL